VKSFVLLNYYLGILLARLSVIPVMAWWTLSDNLSRIIKELAVISVVFWNSYSVFHQTSRSTLKGTIWFFLAYASLLGFYQVRIAEPLFSAEVKFFCVLCIFLGFSSWFGRMHNTAMLRYKIEVQWTKLIYGAGARLSSIPVPIERDMPNLTLNHTLNATKEISQDELSSDPRLCSVCEDNERDCVVLGCGHFFGCTECTTQWLTTKSNQCMICRNPVTGTKKVFWS
jgi:hypothetical protein